MRKLESVLQMCEKLGLDLRDVIGSEFEKKLPRLLLD
jgi:hypothetical protein